MPYYYMAGTDKGLFINDVSLKGGGGSKGQLTQRWLLEGEGVKQKADVSFLSHTNLFFGNLKKDSASITIKN